MFEADRLRRRELPRATVAIGAATIVAFLVEMALGGDAAALVRLGASSHELVWRRGEVHRLVCPIFLHGGVVHLALNLFALAQLGPWVERVFGSWRFVVVYLVSGIAGAAASSGFGSGLSVGASGAIFGVLGFLIGAMYGGRQRHEVRALFRTFLGPSLVFWAAVNLLAGFSPFMAGVRIDNLAHLGGLAAGVALSLVVTETDEAPAPLVALAAALVLAALGSFATLAVLDHRRGSIERLERTAIAALATGQFERAALVCEKLLAEAPRHPRVPEWLIVEGEAFLAAGKLEEARAAFGRSWRVRPTPLAGMRRVEAALAAKDAAGAKEAREELERAFGSEPRVKAFLEGVAAVQSR